MYSSNGQQPPSAPPPATYGQPPMAQYATGVPPQPMLADGKWSTGLCDCGDDVSNCCITCWCPCITFGQIAEIVDKGTTSCGVQGSLYTVLALFTGCQWIYSCMYRSKMRQQYMLADEPCNDCILHCCCESCALCQEYRELKHRGFDTSLGWHGNMARQNQGVPMPPAPFAPAEMKRTKNSIVYDVSQTLMEKLTREAAKVAMVKIVSRIVEGDAGKAICKEAEKVKPIAVVMGTRGRSLMQSVLQGSVSEYCFHNCKAAPVIIVPGIVEAGEESVASLDKR